MQARISWHRRLSRRAFAFRGRATISAIYLVVAEVIDAPAQLSSPDDRVAPAYFRIWMKESHQNAPVTFQAVPFQKAVMFSPVTENTWLPFPTALPDIESVAAPA